MVRRGAVYAAASLVQLVATAAAIPFLTRLLTPSEFGSVVTGLIVVQVTWICASWGIPAAVTRQFLREREGGDEARRLVGASLATATSTVLILWLTSAFWSPLFGFVGPERGLVTSIVAGGVFAVVNSCQALQRAQGAAASFAWSVVLSAGLGNVLGLVLCLTSSNPTHATFLTGLLGGYLAAMAWGLLRARPRVPVEADRSTILRIAVPTLPHMLGIYLVGSIDRIVVSTELGPAAVGRYQVAYFVGSIGLLGLQAVNNAWAPSVIGAPDSTRSSVLRRTTRQLSWLVACGVVATIAFAPVGLAIAAPDSYEVQELVLVASLIALCPIPALVYLAHSHVLYVHGRMRAFAYSAPAALIVGLVVATALSGPWGLPGVALAPLAAQVTLAVLIRRAALECEDESRLVRRVVPASAVAVTLGTVGMVLHLFLS